MLKYVYGYFTYGTLYMKFSKLVILGLALACIFPSCTPASASGLPVVDAAHMAQDMKLSIQSYTQQLKDYATYLQQLEQQINSYKRQIMDATKPYKELYNEAYNAYSKTQNIVNGIKNIQSQYKSTIEWVKNNYGDSEFWKNCAVSQCNPFSQLESAQAATDNALNYASEGGNQSVMTTSELLEQTRKLEQEASEANDKGTATALQNIAMMQANMSQIAAQNNAITNQLLQAQIAAQRQQETEAQAAAQQANASFKLKKSTYKGKAWKPSDFL